MGAQFTRTYAKAWRRSRARLLVVSNAFLTPGAPARLRSVGPRPLTLCHLSNLTAAKGAIIFVELFERLRAAGIKVRARIGGPATEAAVEAALKRAQSNHADCFEWLGPVYGPAKDDLLATSDVFVFPTAYVNEAQPLVLLEALSAGLPILTVRRGCIGCDFDDQVGLVADSVERFPDAAFELLRTLADAPERLRRYKESALAAALAKRDEAACGLETLLRELTCC
jgi:glycosyltransferase involved in cell wall biosynthesis